MSQPIKSAVKYAKPPSAKLLNSRLKQEQNIKKERNKLALASVRDIFSILNPNAGNDEDFDLTDFDCKEYFANPKAFDTLPYFKQVHVINEMNEKLKKNWKSVDKNVKRFSVWWAYGSHGPRDGFVELHDYLMPSEANGIKEGGEIGNVNVNANTNTNTKEDNTIEDSKFEGKKHTELDDIIKNISNETAESSSVSNRSALQMDSNVSKSVQINKRPDVPPDLPFKLPSILKSFKPTNETLVKKLPPLDPRSFGLKRLQQYRQDRRMNPVNRIVIFACILLTVLCFKQDRRVNVTGKVPEYPWEVIEREDREAEAERIRLEKEELEMAYKKIVEEQKAKEKSQKKWYYLWLK